MLNESLLYMLAACAGLIALHFGKSSLDTRAHKYLTWACWLIIALFSIALIIGGVVDLIKLARR